MSFFQKTTVEMKENQRYDQKIFLVFFFKKNVLFKTKKSFYKLFFFILWVLEYSNTAIRPILGERLLGSSVETTSIEGYAVVVFVIIEV